MVHMELIEKYFGGKLTPLQRERFVRLYDLYAEWNARINVVSRKDFDSLYLKHVLHSLAIACACRFDGGAQVCDVGTGGGFPAVPLAIFFPGAHFTAADSIGKKITVVRAVASALGLDNLEAVNCRAEALPGGYDYVVSRAVTEMSVLKGWMWNKITPGRKGTLPNGMLVLKGGDLTAELTAAGGRFEVYDSAVVRRGVFRNEKGGLCSPLNSGLVRGVLAGGDSGMTEGPVRRVNKKPGGGYFRPPGRQSRKLGVLNGIPVQAVGDLACPAAFVTCRYAAVPAEIYLRSRFPFPVFAVQIYIIFLPIECCLCEKRFHIQAIVRCKGLQGHFSRQISFRKRAARTPADTSPPGGATAHPYVLIRM